MITIKERVVLDGRLDRRTYAKRIAEVILLGSVLSVGVIFTTISEAPALAAGFAMMLGGIAWCGFAATVRRLHDRGMSGIWCLVMGLLQAFSSLLNMLDQQHGADVLAVQLGLSAVIVYLLTQTLVMPSMTETNRFGPQPSDDSRSHDPSGPMFVKTG